MRVPGWHPSGVVNHSAVNHSAVNHSAVVWLHSNRATSVNVSHESVSHAGASRLHGAAHVQPLYRRRQQPFCGLQTRGGVYSRVAPELQGREGPQHVALDESVARVGHLDDSPVSYTHLTLPTNLRV